MRPIAVVPSLLLFLLIAPVHSREVWYVPDDFPGGIQAAIADPAVQGGDTVFVRPGTYFENIDFLGKAIILSSLDPGDPAFVDATIIDGHRSGSVVRFVNGEGPDSILTGFTVTNGSGTLVDGVDFCFGGGIYCHGSSPAIRLNRIQGNSAECADGGYFSAGGGIGLYQGAHAHISGNIITDNVAQGSPTGAMGLGGGIGMLEDCSPLVSGNIMTFNTALATVNKFGRGGAIYMTANCHPSVDGNTLSHNLAEGGANYGRGEGGAIYLWDYCNPLIEGNEISHNIARAHGTQYSAGGGICVYRECDPVVNDNDISGNACEADHPLWGGVGGGIFSLDRCSPVISNNTVAGNTVEGDPAEWNGHGGGLWIGHYYYDGGRAPVDHAVITGNVIVGNSAIKYGGGVWLTYDDAVFTNNILSGNTAERGGGFGCELSAPILTNDTIVYNTATQCGGGIWCEQSHLRVCNSILWGDSAAMGPEIRLDSNDATITVGYSDVQGGRPLVSAMPGATVNWDYSSNLERDPLLIAPLEEDFHLSLNSPCIDCGDNTVPSLPDVDVDGQGRVVLGKRCFPQGVPPAQAVVDLGADEYWGRRMVKEPSPPATKIH